jgi:hypothetical protein
LFISKTQSPINPNPDPPRAPLRSRTGLPQLKKPFLSKAARFVLFAGVPGCSFRAFRQVAVLGFLWKKTRGNQCALLWLYLPQP